MSAAPPSSPGCRPVAVVAVLSCRSPPGPSRVAPWFAKSESYPAGPRTWYNVTDPVLTGHEEIPFLRVFNLCFQKLILRQQSPGTGASEMRPSLLVGACPRPIARRAAEAQTGDREHGECPNRFPDPRPDAPAARQLPSPTPSAPRPTRARAPPPMAAPAMPTIGARKG